MKLTPLSSSVSACLCLSLPGAAQEVLFEFQGSAPGERFGRAVDRAGDVDGDGFEDFLVGSPGADVNGVDSGLVQVFSGQNGLLLRWIPGAAAGHMLGGSARAAGDVNGDGYDDIVVGATSDTNCPSTVYGGQYVHVYSGFDGSLLLAKSSPSSDKKRFGFAVSGVGDVDGDGRSDILVGAPDHTSLCDLLLGFGAARVYSGATGSQIYAFGSPEEASLGYSVGDAGDVNADGTPDFIVGDPDYTGETEFHGNAYVYSGANGDQLHLHSGLSNSNHDSMGRVVGPAGDVDADGFDDYIACEGEIGESPAKQWTRVFSGATGLALHTYNRTYSAVDGVGDLTGDGRDDFALGTIKNVVELRSGASGNLMAVLHGAAAGDEFGVSLGAVGDVNGDGVGDLLVGAPQSSGLGPGYARVISGAVCGAKTYCITSPNSAGPGALIGHSGSTSVSQNDFVLTVSGGPPGQLGIFFFAPDATQVPFGNGVLCISGSVLRLPGVMLDATGSGSMALDFTDVNSPAHVIAGESTWNFQYWYRDPPVGAGFNLSDALRAVFCP